MKNKLSSREVKKQQGAFVDGKRGFTKQIDFNRDINGNELPPHVLSLCEIENDGLKKTKISEEKSEKSDAQGQDNVGSYAVDCDCIFDRDQRHKKNGGYQKVRQDDNSEDEESVGCCSMNHCSIL